MRCRLDLLGVDLVAIIPCQTDTAGAFLRCIGMAGQGASWPNHACQAFVASWCGVCPVTAQIGPVSTCKNIGGGLGLFVWRCTVVSQARQRQGEQQSG